MNGGGESGSGTIALALAAWPCVAQEARQHRRGDGKTPESSVSQRHSPTADRICPPSAGEPIEPVTYPLVVEAADGSRLDAQYRIIPGLRVTDAEVRRLVEVVLAAFGRWPRYQIPVSREEHLRWKLDGPPGLENSAHVKEVDGRIVGVGDELRRRYRVRKRLQMGRVGSDAAVDPEWQGRGISYSGRAVARAHRRKRYGFTLGVTTHPTGALHRPDNSALGNPIAAYVRVMRPLQLAAVWREQGTRLPRVAAAAVLGGALVAARLRSRLRRTPRRSAALRLRRVERFDSRLDALDEAAAQLFDFIGERGRDYLNWRFADPRVGPYRVWIAEEGDELFGYVVTRLERSRGFVVDLLAIPGRSDVTDALVERAVSDLDAAGAAGVMCWLARRHPYRATLERHGFLDARRDPPLPFRNEGMDAAELAFLEEPDARPHLMQGDFDIV